MTDAEARRAQKRNWAKKEAEARKNTGRLSYTAEWRRRNPEAYEAQKERARARRAQARAVDRGLEQ